jgi:hypothetical protein
VGTSQYKFICAGGYPYIQNTGARPNRALILFGVETLDLSDGNMECFCIIVILFVDWFEWVRVGELFAEVCGLL